MAGPRAKRFDVGECASSWCQGEDGRLSAEEGNARPPGPGRLHRLVKPGWAEERGQIVHGPAHDLLAFIGEVVGGVGMTEPGIPGNRPVALIDGKPRLLVEFMHGSHDDRAVDARPAI